MSHLHLFSHEICPYVQRASILLFEKNVNFERTYIDLDHKPEWFLELSPLGKVPVLKVDDEVIFESTVICEYLDETHGMPLLPSQPMPKAKQRAWMEFSSELLMNCWHLGMSAHEEDIAKQVQKLDRHFDMLEKNLSAGPYFSGAEFAMVDVFFAPVFRYFEVFDRARDLGLFVARPKLQAWRLTLSLRPSVQNAVPQDFQQRLVRYFQKKGGILASSLVP